MNESETEHYYRLQVTIMRACAIGLLLLLATASAMADSVYTCANSANEGRPYFACCIPNTTRCGVPEGGQVVLTKTPQSNDLVAVGSSGNTLGRQSFWYSSPAVTWQKWSSVKPDTVLGICAGDEPDVERCAYGNGGNSSLQVRSAVVGIVEPFVFTGFKCIPKSIEEVRWKIDGNAGAAVVYCDLPHVIYRQAFCGDPAKLPKTIWSLSMEKLGLAAQSKVSRPCTAAEIALVEEIDADKGVKVNVAVNGTYKDRPVYARNDDNTLGPVIKGVRAPIGAPCGAKRLQTITGARTNYFQFGDGYTLCKVTGAVSKP